MKAGLLSALGLAALALVALTSCSNVPQEQQTACALQALANAAGAAATTNGNPKVASDAAAASVGFGVLCNNGVPISAPAAAPAH